MREQALFEPGHHHDRKLQALGRVQRHHQHACVSRALLLVHVGQQRQPIDEPAERRLELAGLVLPRGGHQLHQVLDAALRLFAAILAEVAQVARTDRAPCRARSTTVSRRARSASEVIRSRNAASDATWRPLSSRWSTAVTSFDHSELEVTVGWRPASSGGRFVVDLRSRPPARARPSRPCRCRAAAC